MSLTPSPEPSPVADIRWLCSAATAPPAIPIPDGRSKSYSSFGGGSGYGGGGGGGFGGWGSQRRYGGGGYAASQSQAIQRLYASQPVRPPPTASQLQSGFSSAREVHRAPSASQPVAKPAARPVAPAPTMVGMPEVRYSKGAAPSMGGGLSSLGSSTNTAPDELPDLDTVFQSSSKDFMAGLKTLGLPDEESAPSTATSGRASAAGATSSTAANGKGKKRLGAGRPTAKPAKKSKT